MSRRILIVIAIIIAIPVLGLAYWLGSPLFRDDVVNEDLLDGITFVTNAPTDPVDLPTTIPDAPTSVSEITVPPTIPPEPTAEVVAVEQEQPTATEIIRGNFRDADSFHHGSGDAILFSLSDGRHLLRFENFNVTNGPDLQVYLVPRTNAEGSSVDISGYIDLGQLKGNTGNQNYFIDAGVAIPENASVVIWCEPFAVLFSVASLGQ